MTKFKNPITIILLISFFLISACADNNSITGNSDKSLGKTTDIIDINSTTGIHPEVQAILDVISELLKNKHGANSREYNECLIIKIFMGASLDRDNDCTCKSYDFRDNYLSKSDKGEVYTACYYLLSRYGIENNLVNKYYKEHYEIFKSSTEIAYSLQHGNNTNLILINKSTSDALKDMLNVYRSSMNHREIDMVLDYLEMDLEKYYNKPKYKIAADFE